MGFKNIYFQTILIMVILLPEFQCREPTRVRKNSQIIEEIEKKVNQISDVLESKSMTDLSGRLTNIESNLFMLVSRMEKVIDWTETNKLSSKVLEDRVDRLESRAKAIEELMTNIVETVVERGDKLETALAKFESDNDNKLRKVIKIISDTYQINKDMTILSDGQSRTSNGPGNERIDELQKKLLEKLSIVEVTLSNQLGSLSITNKALLSSIDNLNNEMLIMRDDRQSNMKSSNKEDHGYDEETHVYDEKSYTKNDQNNDHSIEVTKEQCTLNISKVENEITLKYTQIINAFNDKISVITNKIDDYANACRGRSLGSETGIVIASNDQSHQKRSVISPAPKPSNINDCRPSPDLTAPKNCFELLSAGAKCDGVYVIMIHQTKASKVYCDMTDNGGGWTVILRRGNFSKSKRMISFDHNWNEYRDGFGNIDDGEFWLGLENIHQMTKNIDNELQVDLEAFDGDTISIRYEQFRVGNQQEEYRLYVGEPLPPHQIVGQSLKRHHNHPFTTKDHYENDPNNCAAKLRGGWWFHNCHSAMLTGPYFGEYGRPHLWQGIQWFAWKEAHHLKAAQMKIRSKRMTQYVRK